MIARMQQGLGQIALMVLFFVLITSLAGARLSRWAAGNPARVALMSGATLVLSGTFFIYYWGLAITYGVGRWGFRLGWY